MNPEESSDDPNIFEGDMILTPEQIMAAMNGLDVDDPMGRGSTIGRQWPKGELVYEIDSALARDSRAMAAINGAFKEWSSKTCIKFKKRTNENAYAYFQIGSGCSSYVGRTGRRQTINLARGCWRLGIVAHEIGHALGFYHEQSRPDRDNYVTIMLDNIKEKNKFNFNKYSKSTIDSLNSPYDYGSVMHYSSHSFSKNGKPTIVAKQSGVSIFPSKMTFIFPCEFIYDNVTLGQRRGLSTTDAQQMNMLYKSQCGGGGSSCVDKDKRCGGWTKYCTSIDYVKTNCKKTCKLC
ncbi:hypothetical protein QZH41_018775 [Actinostola sp. cb2023]|nr:hypothetical protein QZH41_018775 [Actinostola sp. cb2023]